jgi:two-component system, NtrC family, sensor kinase
MTVICADCRRVHCIPENHEFVGLICTCGKKIQLSPEVDSHGLEEPHETSLHDTGAMKKELSALIEISRLLVSTGSKDLLLSEILSVTKEVMNVEASSLILYDRERDDMAFYMSKGPGSDEISQIRLAKGEGIAGWVFLNKEPVISDDTSKDERFCRKVDDSMQYTSKNLMCVPILVGNEIIGVMEAVNKKDGGRFRESDLRLFESIANHAGESIEKARLIDENLKSMRLAAIGQTLSSLSHCIKNILNGLTGGSYIINKALAGNDLDMVRNGWDIVDRCIARITDLSMNMLAYSTDRKPPAKLMSPNKIIREVAHLLTTKLDEEHIELTLDLEEQIAEIPMDSVGIFRCLLNLLTNAVEACPEEGGRIMMKSFTKSPQSIIIETSDNGLGISDEEKEKIFSIFFSTKGGKGTGLGLAVTRKIIDEHKGAIWLESKVGEGTRFFIELPMRQP